MKPYRMMQLFRQITQNTTCPECGSSLCPEKISVEVAFSDSAVLSVHCTECDHILTAHVLMATVDAKHLPDFKEDSGHISLQEVELFSSVLKKHTGGIEKLFSQKT